MQKKADKLLEKIVKKDFNNELEIVLEQKEFSEDAKSILLNILYKIETAYKDIETVKPDIFSKDEYILKLIWTIKQQCSSIKLVRMDDENSRIPENGTFFIDKEKKEIECYPIERKILYAIWKMGKKERIMKSNNFLIDTALSDFLNIGNAIDLVEPLRDFNGYSWSTLFTELESIEHYLIYQNLRMLVGNKFLTDWIYHQENLIDYYTSLTEKLGKKATKVLNTIAILTELKFKPEKIKIYGQDKKRIETELNNMEDKEKYTEMLTKEKLSLTKKIRRIDKVLNNKDLLQQEYIKRNEALPLEEKIFSMKVLSNIMIKERENLQQKIKELNDNMNPKNFIEHKKEIENQYQYFALLDTQDIDKQIQENLVKFQKIFLDEFSNQIDNVQTKQEIITTIYKMRYYLQLPITREKSISEAVPEKYLQPVVEKMLNKARELKAISKISKDENIEYRIWRKILTVRAIKIEDLSIKIIKDKQQKQYILQIFDENIFEEKVAITDFQEKIDLKLNKRIQIFQ